MSMLVGLISFSQFAFFCELMFACYNLLEVIFQILYQGLKSI